MLADHCILETFDDTATATEQMMRLLVELQVQFGPGCDDVPGYKLVGLTVKMQFQSTVDAVTPGPAEKVKLPP